MRIPSLGFFVPPIPAADQAPDCDGPERSNGTCCSWRTWSNQTHGAVRGQEALFKLNEDRVRALLHDLLDPPAPGRDPAMLEAAYDAGLPPPTELYQQAKAAAQRFWAMFPPERWYYKQNVTATDCQSDGFYGGYRQKEPSPGSSQPADWYAEAKDVIMSVPGSASHLNNRAQPEGSDAVLIAKAETTGVPLPGGPKIRPTAWFRKFLEVFGPSQARRPVLFPARPKVPFPQAARPKVPFPQPSPILTGKEGEAPQAQPEQGKSPAMIAAAVIGSAVLAGGAYYLLTD